MQPEDRNSTHLIYMLNPSHRHTLAHAYAYILISPIHKSSINVLWKIINSIYNVTLIGTMIQSSPKPFLPVALYLVGAQLDSVEDELETMGADESQEWSFAS